MRAPDIKYMVRILLRRYGRTFAEDLGIPAQQNQPSPLYRLLTSAALFSTRINHSIALKSARALFEHGWTTPETMAASTWEQRVRALDEGGYVRYDERTATMLGRTAQILIDGYRGDLRNLREAAGADPARERELLDQFPGIGDVAVNIFFREVQLAWPELFPFADERTLASAARLQLPADAAEVAALVGCPSHLVSGRPDMSGHYETRTVGARHASSCACCCQDDWDSPLVRSHGDYVRLVSALIRVQLERKHDQVLAEARVTPDGSSSARH